jgi:hypothetical protein
LAVDHLDLDTGFGEIPGRGDADDTSAENQNFQDRLALTHLIARSV